MSTAESFPVNIDAPLYERQPDIDARKLLASRPELLVHFYFDFYKQFCTPDEQSTFNTILSLGEAASSVVVARQNHHFDPASPNAYSIKQYDLMTSEIHDWTVTDASAYSGRGDTFERSLELARPSGIYEHAQLYLSNKGNQWNVNETTTLLRSAHLLPFQSMYDLSTSESQLCEMYSTMPYQNPRRIGKAVLYQVL